MKYAMILAAGRGERLRPFTDHTPKPLLAIGGTPIIVWHIQKLAEAGFTDILINHAWLGNQIEETLQDGKKWGVRLHYSAETQALETAGGIRQALYRFPTADPLLVINGDIWIDWSFVEAHAIADQLVSQQYDAWILLTPNPEHHPNGDFALPVTTTDAIWCLPNKPPFGSTATFSGVGIYQPHFFDTVPVGTASKLAPLLRAGIEKKKLLATLFDGTWLDIGTPERLKYMDTLLKEHHPHSGS